jgi:hypothetical protein
MEDRIKLFCEKLSKKLNKTVTFKSEKLTPNIKGGENYRIIVNGKITKLIINGNDYTDNVDEQNELIEMCVEYCRM